MFWFLRPGRAVIRNGYAEACINQEVLCRRATSSPSASSQGHKGIQPGSQVEGFAFTLTRIEQYTVDSATNDQLASWTMNHFEFPEVQSASVANVLADVLDAHLGTDPERLNKAITAAPDLLTDVDACLSSVLQSVRILQMPG